MALSTIQEGVWFKRFLDHLGVIKNVTKSMLVNCDSQAVIAYTKDPKYLSNTEHIYKV